MIKSLFLVILIFLIFPVSATPYYVNTTGDNAKAGTSPGTAWETVTYGATQIRAGDILWVDGGLGGGNYGNENVLLNYNGTVGNPIVFHGYNGTPILDGIDAASSRGIYGEYKEYIEFHNFEIKDYNYGIAAIFSNNFSIYNTTLHSNVGYGTWFRNCSYMLTNNSTAYDNSMTGFQMLSCWNCTVNHSEANGSQDYGIAFSSWLASNDGGYGHTATWNYIHDNQNHGIAIRFGVDDSLIENNVLSNNRINIQINENTPTYTAPSGNIIRNNTIALYREHAIYLAGQATNNEVSNNNITCMDNTTQDPIFFHNVGTGNVAKDNYINATLLEGFDAACASAGNTGVTFQNHTITSGTTDYVIGWGSTTNIIRDDLQNTTIKLFYDTSSTYIRYYDGSVFSVSGSVSGAIPTYHTQHSYTGTYLQVGTAEVLTTDVSNSNIKIKPTNDYIYQVVVNNNADDVYNLSVNSTVGENPCWINITADNASSYYSVYRDGIPYDTVISGSDSVIRYYYSVIGNEWGSHTFEFAWSSGNDSINYIPPTLANDSTTPNDYVEVNASINTTSLTSMIWNWDGANTTFLNSSCILCLSLNNNSVIGDNDTVAIDVSQYGNNASFVNGNTGNWTANGMSFDGVNDVLNCGADESLNITDVISIDVNVTRDTIGSNQVIAAKGGSVYANIAYQLFFTDTDKLLFYISQDGTSTVKEYFTTTNSFASLIDSYHIVATFDGADIKIYVNSINEAGSTTGTATSIFGSTADLKIGARFTTPGLFYHGTVDKVKIYNYVLSHEEVNQSYMSSLYKFDDNQWYFFTKQTSLNTGKYNYQIFANSIESDYRIVTVRTPSIIIPANSLGLFNNWTAVTTFTNIAANESNDVCYSYYNVTTGEWVSYYPPYSWNTDYVILKEASVFGFFDAETIITFETKTPVNTSLSIGWNMLFLMGTDNETIADIKADIGVNCTAIWWFNSTSGAYSNTSTDTIQPCQGFLAYLTQNMTPWVRSDL